MIRETERMVRLLGRTYEQGAWHGPSVKEALQDITAETALCRLPHTHSIIELVAHMTAWRTFVTRRLQGDYEYNVNDAMNFPVVTDWLKVVEAMDTSQAALLKAIETFDEAKLGELVPHSSYRYTYYTLIHGIVHHDLYHTGQIMLVKKTFSAV